MIVMELPEEQVAALTAKAAAEGLSLQDWLRSLAEEPVAMPGSLQSVADIVLEEMRKVPAEAMAALPNDGAIQHDHYIYGWPKKEV